MSDGVQPTMEWPNGVVEDRVQLIALQGGECSGLQVQEHILVLQCKNCIYAQSKY